MTGGVLYEVVIDVAPEARAAYLEWLRPHMAEMLNFDGFLSAALYQDAEDDCLLTCRTGSNRARPSTPILRGLRQACAPTGCAALATK